VAIGIADRRIHVLSGCLFTQIRTDNTFTASELDSVSDQIYDWFKTGKSGADFGRTSWYRPLMKQYLEMPQPDLMAKVD
jgi:hypothetical protein